MKTVIVGASFDNKGAQSMLFTTVAALRRAYPDVKIFFAHSNAAPGLNGKFLFEEIYYSKWRFEINADNIGINPPGTPWGSLEETVQTIREADLLIDVSGFGLGSKRGVRDSFAYLNNIKIARAFNVPIILMPQSFGPFDFGDYQNVMDAEIKNTLAYPEKIFAREYDGFFALSERYGFDNLDLQPDLVLASPKVKPADIYKTVPTISVPKVLEAPCVGIVPNLRGFDKGNPWQTLQAYYEMINFLLKEGKLVYLFRHSEEDLTPCTWLKALFAQDGRVVLWENDFSCFEYDAVCQQFDFLIVGRFHGIVHAYRNNIPCLLMGWAVKYRELAQLMYQSRYIFDLSAPDLDVRKIFSAIRDMEDNLTFNKKILRERLAQVQADAACFDAVTKILDKVSGRHSA